MNLHRFYNAFWSQSYKKRYKTCVKSTFWFKSWPKRLFYTGFIMFFDRKADGICSFTAENAWGPSEYTVLLQKMPGARRNMQFYCGKCPGPDGICSFTAGNARGPTEYAVLLRKMPGARANMQFYCGKCPGPERIYSFTAAASKQRSAKRIVEAIH